jgi:hypothetical protein
MSLCQSIRLHQHNAHCSSLYLCYYNTEHSYIIQPTRIIIVEQVVVVPLHYSPYVGLGIPKVSWSVSVHSVVSDQPTDSTQS